MSHDAERRKSHHTAERCDEGWMQFNSPQNFGGNFTITGGTVAPIYLDSDYGTSSFPTSGDNWKVLWATGGACERQRPGRRQPQSLENGSIEPAAPPVLPLYWKLIAL